MAYGLSISSVLNKIPEYKKLSTVASFLHSLSKKLVFVPVTSAMTGTIIA